MTTKAIKNYVCGFMAAIVFTACDGNSIEGKWIEPVPGMENQMQGINLEKGRLYMDEYNLRTKDDYTIHLCNVKLLGSLSHSQSLLRNKRPSF